MTERDIKAVIEEHSVIIFSESMRGMIEMRVDGGQAARKILEGLKQKEDVDATE